MGIPGVGTKRCPFRPNHYWQCQTIESHIVCNHSLCSYFNVYTLVLKFFLYTVYHIQLWKKSDTVSIYLFCKFKSIDFCPHMLVQSDSTFLAYIVANASFLSRRGLLRSVSSCAAHVHALMVWYTAIVTDGPGWTRKLGGQPITWLSGITKLTRGLNFVGRVDCLGCRPMIPNFMARNGLTGMTFFRSEWFVCFHSRCSS